MRASCSVQRPSRSISSRCLALILKWNWHFGQTRRLASRSLRKTMVRQDSHLTQRPSVRPRRSSGGVDCSIDFLSRLNQAIVKSHQRSVAGRNKRPVSAQNAQNHRSIVYTTLGQNAFGVGVLHLAHFRDQVSQLDKLRMSVAARADHVDALGTALQRLHELVRTAVDGVASSQPAVIRHLDVFGIGFRTADLHEAAAHRPDLELVVAEHFRSIELAVVPRALDELHHQDAKALPDRAKRSAKRTSRLALAGPGVNDQESLVFRHRICVRETPASAWQRSERLKFGDSAGKGQASGTLHSLRASKWE